MFNVPTRCTTGSVNKALASAGILAHIYRDPYNNHAFSVAWGCDGCDLIQRTRYETARAVADAFNTGALAA
jgi:hypothetical protein